MMITRRSALAGATALPFAAPFAAGAQSKFPDHPIKLIVPWAAGGPADAGFRILGEAVQASAKLLYGKGAMRGKALREGALPLLEVGRRTLRKRRG